jgi:AraC-like DNA-binding protein
MTQGWDVRGLPQTTDLDEAVPIRSEAGEDTNGADATAARRLQIKRHIRANLADPGLSPTSIADALYLSRRTLYAALTPDDEGVAAEIRRQRLDCARAMLADPSQARSVAQIASAVGLTNAAHFTRIFRARYGLSPSQFRPPTNRSKTRPLRIVGHGRNLQARATGGREGDPLEGLREARRLETALDNLTRESVRHARAAGHSWTEIGQALDVAKETASERYSR